MSINKILGATLSSTLDRQGVDLEFVSNAVPLLSLNFANSRAAINTNAAICSDTFTVNGSLLAGNILINGNVISSLSNISFGGSELTNIGYPNSPASAASVQYVLNSVSTAVGAISVNSIHSGASSVVVSNIAGPGLVSITVDGNLMASITNTSVTTGEITFSSNTISSSGDIILKPNLGNVVTINSTTALTLPVGTSAQRPAIPVLGDIRYNTTAGVVEVYNGTVWVSDQAIITDQQIVGDGVHNSFTLIQPATTVGVMVATNGVVQVPNVAYTVSGTTITFVEIPLATDTIDIRFLSTTVPAMSELPSSLTVNQNKITVGTIATQIDSFPSLVYRSAKYLISVSTADGHSQYAEVIVVQNGTAIIITNTMTINTNTGVTPVSITYASSIVSGQCVVTATSSRAGSILTIQAIYFGS